MKEYAAPVKHIQGLIAGKRFDEALVAVEEARATMPDHFPLMIKHAAVMRLLGQPAEALDVLEPGLAMSPDNLGLRSELALSLREIGETERCLAVIEETLTVHPEHVPSRMTQINTLISEKRLGEALKAIEAARSAIPGHLPFAGRHAGVLRQLGRPEEAVALLEYELSTSPDDLALRNELAVCLQQMGETERCLALTEETLSAHPGHVPSLMARINTLIAEQRLGEALEAVELAHAAIPGYQPFLIKHSGILRRLGRPEEAVALLEPELAGSPADLNLRSELALGLRQMGETQRSLSLTEGTLEAHPGHLPSMMARLDILIELNDRSALEDMVSNDLLHSFDDASHPEQRIAKAKIMAKVLPKLPAETASHLLKANCEYLNRVAPDLGPETLWPLYSGADQLGIGSRLRPLLADLLGRDWLPLSVSSHMVRSLYRHGCRDWTKIATRLETRLAPTDRWYFRLECEELDKGAAAALALRRGKDRPLNPVSTLSLVSLLTKAGKVRVALRYLKRVRRTWPLHARLFQEMLNAMIATGAVDDLRAILKQEEARRPDFQMAKASALFQIGDFQAAEAAMQQIENPQQKLQLEKNLLENYLCRGESDVAEALFEHVRRSLPYRASAQIKLGINGVLMSEMSLGRLDGKAKDASTSITNAGDVLKQWLDANPEGGAHAQSPLPRQMVQYWNTQEPPDDIAQIMEGWRDAPGVSYARFDRQNAMNWLATRLGNDWKTAFRGAVVPAQESDFFRLAWLMLEGGLYVDSDDRLLGNLQGEFDRHRGLTVFLEPFGTLVNNVIFAPPMHPVIVWAAHAAKRALEERHSDNSWSKTGPGLLTRAVAWYVSEHAPSRPDLRVLPRYTLGTWMQPHVQLPYKQTKAHWNSHSKGAGKAADLAEMARHMLIEDTSQTA